MFYLDIPLGPSTKLSCLQGQFVCFYVYVSILLSYNLRITKGHCMTYFYLEEVY